MHGMALAHSQAKKVVKLGSTAVQAARTAAFQGGTCQTARGAAQLVWPQMDQMGQGQAACILRACKSYCCSSNLRSAAHPGPWLGPTPPAPRRHPQM